MSQVTVIVIPAAEAEPVRRVTIDSGNLNDVQNLVHGYFEVLAVRADLGAAFLLNEDGKVEGQPPNIRATRLALAAEAPLRPGDFLVGDIAVIGVLNQAGQRDSEAHDCPEAFLTLLAEFGHAPE